MKKEDIARLEALCLRHSGVTLLGFEENARIASPKEAWTHIIRVESKPSLVFADEHMAEAEERWWNLALSRQLASKYEDVLVSIGGIGQLPWARIRLPAHTPVFDIFALTQGSPEFIVMSGSGDHLLAVTSEEDETWLYLVDCQGHDFKTIMFSAEV